MIVIQLAEDITIEFDPSSLLDIQRVTVAGVELSPRRAIPDDGDPRIDHSLEGLLFTCGPDHIRHPVAMDGKTGPGRVAARFPLHGSFSGHAAERVDRRLDGQGREVLTTSILIQRADGWPARLDRQITVNRDQLSIAMADRVTNIAEVTLPVFAMYHMNIAGCILGEETRLAGAMFEGEAIGWRFGDEPGSVFCLPAPTGQLSLGPMAAAGGLSLAFAFTAATLPFLQMWRNQKSPAHVLGIEPVSHRLTSREALQEAGEFHMLAPGQSFDFGVTITFHRRS